jgi:hypothetical protein
MIDQTPTTPATDSAKNPRAISLARLHPLLTALEIQLTDARGACEALAEIDMDDASRACTYLVSQLIGHVDAVHTAFHEIYAGIRAETNAPEAAQ